MVYACNSESDSTKTEAAAVGTAKPFFSQREDFPDVPFQSTERRGLGGDSSGGGPGVVCYRGNRVVSVQNLDVYEAKILWRKQIIASNAPVSAQLELAVARLRSIELYFAIDVERALQWISKHYAMAPNGDYFTQQPHDLGESWVIPTKENCRIAYVGFYDKAGVLKISGAAYAKMNNTDRAAFLLHEALYALGRERAGLENSENVRLLVGTLLEKDFQREEAVQRADSFRLRLPPESVYFMDRRGGYLRFHLRLPEYPEFPNATPTSAKLLFSCLTADGTGYAHPITWTNARDTVLEMRDIGCVSIYWEAETKGGDGYTGGIGQYYQKLSYDENPMPSGESRYVHLYDKNDDFVPDFSKLGKPESPLEAGVPTEGKRL